MSEANRLARLLIHSIRPATLFIAFALALAVPLAAQIQQAPSRRADHSLDVLKKAGMFTIFMEAVAQSPLKDNFDNGKSYTLFVPRDEAFADLDPQELEALRDPANRQLLVRLVLNHFVEHEYHAEVEGKAQLTTLAGDPITYNKRGKRLMLNGNVRVIKADITTRNGVIHVIDKVILPPDFKVALKTKAKQEQEAEDKQS